MSDNRFVNECVSGYQKMQKTKFYMLEFILNDKTDNVSRSQKKVQKVFGSVDRVIGFFEAHRKDSGEEGKKKETSIIDNITRHS